MITPFWFELLPAQHSTVIQNLTAHMTLEGCHGGDLVRRHGVGFRVTRQELVVVFNRHPDLVRVGSLSLVAQL